jgi:MFS family permease
MSEVHLNDACDSTGKAELSTGWPVLLAATLGCGAGLSSLPFYSLGTFIAPLQQEFGWARGEISASFLYLTLTLALTAPALGWLLDRIGPRKIAMVAIPCFAAVLFAMSRFDGPLVAFHSLFAIAALVGGGTCPILYTRAVNARFHKMRGLALGITLAGMGIAAIVLPPLLSVIIAEHGWRTGYLLLACLALVPWLFVITAFRNTAVEARPKPAQRRAVLTGALTSRIFWTIALGFAAIAIAVSALVVHMVPLLRDAGMPPLQAATVASFTGFGVLLGRLVIGWLIDRFFAPRVAAIVFTLTAIGCLLLVYGGPLAAPFAAFLIGFSLGAEVDLISYLTARYFGMSSYGVLYALIYACFIVGASIGPVLAGKIFDMTGNYSLAIWTVIGLLLTGAGATLTLPRFDASPAKLNPSPDPIES